MEIFSTAIRLIYECVFVKKKHQTEQRFFIVFSIIKRFDKQFPQIIWNIISKLRLKGQVGANNATSQKAGATPTPGVYEEGRLTLVCSRDRNVNATVIGKGETKYL